MQERTELKPMYLFWIDKTFFEYNHTSLDDMLVLSNKTYMANKRAF